MADFLLSAFADEAAERLERQIEALKRNNIKRIEIRNVNGKCIIDCSKVELVAIKKQLDENGIMVSSIGSPIGKYNIEEPFDIHLERFQRAIETAKILKTKRIRMFSFFIPKGAEAEQYREEVLSRLEVFTTLAKQNGVVCCHENEKEIYGDVKKRVLELHENNSDLKGIFDPANYIQCKEDPKSIFADLKPYIDYIHIKDAIMEDGIVVPAGKGDGAIATILDSFYEQGKEKLLTVEPHLTVFSGLSNLQDEELKHKYTYQSQGEAFDVAVTALKDILDKRGYCYE
ncbi:TIM barrel protein [Paludicola sp. MB14-C6]|uniref:sugar phosphate isomerase/epimerase family protein n=1 Tax=Paludihabitans sp. MB14-C6 TaxID=3070656 RepID=UPI0027DD3647|nr:TIM barrel protein [Paludicola sp. MB14-C6]WMJ23261.1 TIM barrel protein [Paludicola sp. MB14-C6]